MTRSRHMQWMLDHAAKGEAWTRPHMMAATVNGGEKLAEVFEAFAAAPDERERVHKMLGLEMA